MTEQAAWAKLTSIAEVVRTLAWSEETHMYLERVPHAWVDDQEREQGIRLEHYDNATVFDSWQRGRIFNADQEIKWEQTGEQFHGVYCGDTPPKGFTPIPLGADHQRVQAYYLWGQRVKDSDYEKLGISTEISAYVELQIPRILRYPVATQPERVKVAICEFYAPDGQLCYARWCGLQ